MKSGNSLSALLALKPECKMFISLFLVSSNSKNTLSGFTTLFLSYHPGWELLLKTLFSSEFMVLITPKVEMTYVSADAPSARKDPARL